MDTPTRFYHDTDQQSGNRAVTKIVQHQRAKKYARDPWWDLRPFSLVFVHMPSYGALSDAVYELFDLDALNRRLQTEADVLGREAAVASMAMSSIFDNWRFMGVVIDTVRIIPDLDDGYVRYKSQVVVSGCTSVLHYWPFPSNNGDYLYVTERLIGIHVPLEPNDSPELAGAVARAVRLDDERASSKLFNAGLRVGACLRGRTDKPFYNDVWNSQSLQNSITLLYDFESPRPWENLFLIGVIAGRWSFQVGSVPESVLDAINLRDDSTTASMLVGLLIRPPCRLIYPDASGQNSATGDGVVLVGRVCAASPLSKLSTSGGYVYVPPLTNESPCIRGISKIFLRL